MNSLDNDSYGKYHEIMLSKFLTGNFPERPKVREWFKEKHQRETKSRSQFDSTNAETYFNGILTKFNLSQDELDVHNIKAKTASLVLKQYFDQLNHEILKVFWTSNGNDLRWLFGKDNTNPSDIVVKTKGQDPDRPGRSRTFLTGIIVKNYSKKKGLTAANLGKATMDNLFKVDTTDIYQNLYYDIADNTKKFGITLEKTKEQLHKIEKTIPELLKTNAELMNSYCQQISDSYKESLYKFTKSELKDVIVKVVHGEQTKIRKLYLNSYGLSNFEHELIVHNELFEKLFAKHAEHLHIKETYGRSIIIAGRDDASIVQIGIKGRTSGGWTTPLGNVKGILNSALR